MEKLKQIKNWTVEQVLWAEKELRGKTGAEKKAAVVKRLDDLIQLPFYLEWVDDIIISYLVDQACEKLNAISAHSFADIDFNDVDKARIAEELKVQNGK